jgi:hypothetical protein
MQAQPGENSNQMNVISKSRSAMPHRPCHVYLAGRMYASWRNDLGDFGADGRSLDNDRGENFHALQELEVPLYPPLDSFVCIGPFLMRHSGGDHQLHGQVSDCHGFPSDRRTLVELIGAWITRADLLLCWLEGDALAAYGTVAEIGYAKARGIPVVIALADDFPHKAHRDLWIALNMADLMLHDTTPQNIFLNGGVLRLLQDHAADARPRARS